MIPQRDRGMPNTRAIQRHDISKVVGLGLVVMAGPPLLAAGILVFAPAGMWLAIGIGACSAAALMLAPVMLKVVDRLEIDGEKVRFRRLWTRKWAKKTSRDVVGLKLQASAQGLTGGHAPRKPRVHIHAYDILFSDGSSLYLNFQDFPGAGVAVKTLARDPDTHLAFPIVLGDLYLSNIHVYDHRDLGRTVVYADPGGATFSIYIYDKGLAHIPDGVSPEVHKEFGEAKQEILDVWHAAAPAGAVVEHRSDSMVPMSNRESAPETLRALFDSLVGDCAKEDRLYMTGYGRHFLKVRVSAAADRRDLDDLCDKVLDHLCELMAGNAD